MSLSLHNTQGGWFLDENKTREFCFNRSALGWFKVDSAATALWFVTCRRAADVFHNQQLRKTQRYKKVRDSFTSFRIKRFLGGAIKGLFLRIREVWSYVMRQISLVSLTA